MRKLIEQQLRRIEDEERIEVVYACESGSRAWGFESKDSDYDVRFIYIRPTEWYLTIQDKRDVIEYQIDERLDISGWDFPKALELFRRSNPPLLEWLQSPIVYLEKRTVIDRIRKLMPEYYSPVSCMYHYLHMAQGNYREYLQGQEVWLKKYFYVLRPVLACLWIERGLGVVPMEFSILVDGLVDDAALKHDIEELTIAKKQGAELDRGTRIASISNFLDEELSRLNAKNQRSANTKDPSILDHLFLATLIEVNGTSIEQGAAADAGSRAG